jgi:hypothetical protein
MAAWRAKTETLCREKVASITGLGYVHITYAGIARVGLPAVKRAFERYLDRLLAVLREFSRRQQQLVTPAPAAAAMRTAAVIDRQSQAATIRLRSAVSQARSATDFTAAVKVWLTTLRGLGSRGDALARRLRLPGCVSASGRPSP